MTTNSPAVATPPHPAPSLHRARSRATATATGAAVFALALAAAVPSQDPGLAAQLSPERVQRVEAALERAGQRADAWRAMLAALPAAQQDAGAFLVANMPDADLRDLDPAFVATDIGEAHDAWRRAPWADTVPREVFLEAILPYAHTTEPRAPWRAMMRSRFADSVADCKSPGEAALRLNEVVFSTLGVRYSRDRKRADQNAQESIELGIASCTGLSILLADACRAVGVPARLAGIAEWPNKRGNHTWVEVWSEGRWHFLGAAEPDKAGLNRTWFLGDVAHAVPGSRRHGVWAAVWGHTGDWFPAVWARGARVPAVDSTALYRPLDRPDGPQAPRATDAMRLMVVVVDATTGRRIEAEVAIDDRDSDVAHRGTSHDESHDGNDHLTFEVPRARTWRVVVRNGDAVHERVHTAPDAAQEILRIALGDPIEALAARMTEWYTNAFVGKPLPAFTDEEHALLASHGPKAREVAWRTFLEAPIHKQFVADLEAGVVRSKHREAAFTVKEVGERPATGWGLVIAMHGGGGVPKRVNDSQWRHMQVYYRDHPEAGGYKYVALRAPNDEWNGFYDTAISPLIENLIRQFVVGGDVDPDRVYAIGYSHGGYGAFGIGPKLADRFAAVHASAAAPTGGITAAENLRHLPFSFMVGERDTAYGRAERCQAFDAKIRQLRGDRDDIYPVRFEFIAGNGHTGLPDRDKLAELRPLVRGPLPRDITWHPTGPEVITFYWLRALEPTGPIEASIEDNVLTLRAGEVTPLLAHLDDRLVDIARPLVVRDGDDVRELALTPKWENLLFSILERADPKLSSTCDAKLR